MAENSPAYLMYPGDILASGRVAALEPLEELWYRRAIDLGWEPQGMPADPTEFAGWVGRGCTTEAAQKLIDRFYKPHKKDASKVVNKRQELERTKFKQKSRVRAEAGRLSGIRRRELRELAAEQLLNKGGTKTNIPIPISIPIPNEDLNPIWGDFLSVLKSKGLTEERARIQIGKLLKDYKDKGGDTFVVECYRDTRDKVVEAVSPLPYFRKCLKSYVARPTETYTAAADSIAAMNARRAEEAARYGVTLDA